MPVSDQWIPRGTALEVRIGETYRKSISHTSNHFISLIYTYDYYTFYSTKYNKCGQKKNYTV